MGELDGRRRWCSEQGARGEQDIFWYYKFKNPLTAGFFMPIQNAKSQRGKHYKARELLL